MINKEYVEIARREWEKWPEWKKNCGTYGYTHSKTSDIYIEPTESDSVDQ